MSRLRLFSSFVTAVLLTASAFAATPTFFTLDDETDPTFNQLLGINNEGVIVGYFGSGAQDHPNKGYQLLPPYGQANYVNENFPGSVQTQVTGINNLGKTVGFWSSAAGVAHGFTMANGQFLNVNEPGTTFNQLLGQNDHAQAAGYFSSNAAGTGPDTAYVYDENGGLFATYSFPGNITITSVQATGVNNVGTLCGFYVDAAGNSHGWMMVLGRFTALNYPGAQSTQALGLNNINQVVGSYIDGGGLTHGFLYNTNTTKWESIDDPNGVGTTVVNGINDVGQAVGFYIDVAGNTNGMLIQGIE